MRVLIGIGHPAHVHFFKNVIWKLEEDGHKVRIIARDKEVALKLLNAYGFGYELYGKYRKNLLNKILEIPYNDYLFYKIAKEFKPDILTGILNYTVTHIGKLINKPSIIFTDTERATFANKLVLPFADVICTPASYTIDLGKKQVRYNGYKELAYLHPNYFKQDPSVLEKIGLSKNDRFIVLRFVAWSATHDISHRGLDLETKRKLVKELSNYGKVVISSENLLSKEFEKYRINIPPEKMHDLLYYATMYIGESPTMTTESAILGTPAICVSSWAYSCGNFEDLSNYGLIHCFPDQNGLIEFVTDLIKCNDIKMKWQKKREKLLREKIDVTKFIVDFIERYPQSHQEYLERLQ